MMQTVLVAKGEENRITRLCGREGRLYGDNVFEKHGINRDRTGDGEKPRCLCGKRGIFNRDGAANYQTT